MIAAQADGAVEAYLLAFTEDVLIRDSRGRILGFFKPWAIAEEAIFQKAKGFYDIDEVQKQYEAKGWPGVPFEEVKRHLEALGRAGEVLGLTVPQEPPFRPPSQTAESP